MLGYSGKNSFGWSVELAGRPTHNGLINNPINPVSYDNNTLFLVLLEDICNR